MSCSRGANLRPICPHFWNTGTSPGDAHVLSFSTSSGRPAKQRLSLRNGFGFLRQEEKGGLQSIFGVVRVAQGSAATP
jgi:hypothetical protein